ncbi:hypothetical protein SUGI_0490660 [Cryptomeria japonica]|uniref:36.4 kDa proline-rich protein n=1 Tax=Cryptomeria japonica TaxID=3369 RepID=UPI002408E039|nr:36.4 kDa proline-rich protein [Cryptomeria japonica]GLJ25613.1 hypothetical protein SUGI_0490660 [Cryptomeria japonica]
MMKRAATVVFIIMVEVATSMPVTMANGWYTYAPSPSIGRTPPSNTTAPKCPLDALKLGACVDLLNGLAHVVVGDPVANKCCPVIQGVLELEAALCLCTTIRVKLLNLSVVLPIALSLVTSCGMSVPPGFQCPNQ